MKRDLLARLEALETKHPEQISQSGVDIFSALLSKYESNPESQDPTVLKFKCILSNYSEDKASLGDMVTGLLAVKHR